MNDDESSRPNKWRNRIESAQSYSDVWSIVKNTVNSSIGSQRRHMMLFLDDLPIQLGAYHPIGTNNIILNRTLVETIEVSVSSKHVVNALVYNLLLHEYLHALGEYSEIEVRRLVIKIAEESFGKQRITAKIARNTPWSLLKNIPLKTADGPKRVVQIVKDFEEAGNYIV